MYRIEILPLAGSYVVALKDPDTGDLLKTLSVNASAAEILRFYNAGMDIPTIARALSEKYGVPDERILVDVEAVIAKTGLGL